MKQIFFTLLLFCVAGLYSCRKDSSTQVDIKTFDQQQIQSYIAANGLTGFTRDLAGGDTTGIYYKIISQGKGPALGYPDLVSIAFTVTTFDGGFSSLDSLDNHVYNYVGHLTGNLLPVGIELAIINIMKNKGTRARVLIPSHLGYGVSGSTLNGTATANPIKGNQCLDYYINIINTDPIVNPATGKNVVNPVTKLNVTGQDVYDSISIQKYITRNNLTGFKATGSGLYYKITSAAAGAMATKTSLVTAQYSAYRLNGLLSAEQANATDGSGAVIDLTSDTRKGLAEALQLAPVGSKLTIIIPSALGFGNYAAYSDSALPVFSCLQYDINIISIQ